jgi:hypothetical protein
MLAIRTVVLSMVSTVAGVAGVAGGGGCAANASFDGPGASGDPGAGAPASCLSSNECPTGFTCNEFHVCVAPSSTSDGGVPAETEIALGAPISSQRYVYVAMTAQNKLARITPGARSARPASPSMCSRSRARRSASACAPSSATSWRRRSSSLHAARPAATRSRLPMTALPLGSLDLSGPTFAVSLVGQF